MFFKVLRVESKSISIYSTVPCTKRSLGKNLKSNQVKFSKNAQIRTRNVSNVKHFLHAAFLKVKKVLVFLDN